MPQDRAVFVGNQSQFYRKNYRKLITFAYVLIAFTALSMAVVVYETLIRPIPKYFATTSDGRLIEIQPL